MLIKDFTPNTTYVLPLLIKDVKNGTTNKGAPYLSMTLADSSASIEAKFWDVKPHDVEVCQTGKVIQVTGDSLDYKGVLQLRVNKVESVDQNSVDLTQFVARSSIDLEERESRVQFFIDAIENEKIKKLTVALLQKVGDKYYSYPAASKIHHNFLGGLSEHSLGMAKLCWMICKQYPQLNRDLLVAGALIHDVGKTVEMSGPVTTEYTLEGKLEGHISIANGMLTEVAESLGLEGTEEAILLHHLILSHHGHYEFGSPVLPLIQEAEVLSLVDNMDARLNTLKQALEPVKPGGYTSKLFALENRAFYKPVLK